MRGKQFQLLGFALLVEHLHAFQPPRLRGTVQLTQAAERSLARTVDRSHRLHQRPVGVLLTVFRAVVRSQEHLARSWHPIPPFSRWLVYTTRRFPMPPLQTQPFLRSRTQNLPDSTLPRRTWVSPTFAVADIFRLFCD